MSASHNLANKQKVSPVVEVVALALFNTVHGKYLLARRAPGGSGAGFWEFPGGKIEPGETKEQALSREINEELSFDLGNLQLSYIGENLHCYDSPRRIKIYLYRAAIDYEPRFKLLDHDQSGWYSLAEIKEINLSQGDKYFISLL